MGLSKEQMDNLWYAMGQVGSRATFDGRWVATKTGTMPYRDTRQIAHASVVGFTPQVAMAVWIGNRAQEAPIKTAAGQDIYGSGLPTSILAGYLKGALAGVPKEEFPTPPFVGDRRLGNVP
jgi:membrane peptidoglycan carboxypeptidase